MLRGLLDHVPDDPGVGLHQVVAAHPRLARDTRGHDDDVGAGRVGVVVRAQDVRIVADDRRRLGQVETLALGQSLDDVDEDDVGDPGFGDPLSSRGTDIAGADDGDLVACHESGVSLSSGTVERAGADLRLRLAGAGRGDRRVDAVGEGREVVVEHAGERRSGSIVRLRVGPGRARVEER